jgi:hypothetical protein
LIVSFYWCTKLDVVLLQMSIRGHLPEGPRLRAGRRRQPAQAARHPRGLLGRIPTTVSQPAVGPNALGDGTNAQIGGTSVLKQHEGRSQVPSGLACAEQRRDAKNLRREENSSAARCTRLIKSLAASVGPFETWGRPQERELFVA